MKIHLSRKCNFSAKKLVIFGGNKPPHPRKFQENKFRSLRSARLIEV